MSFGKAAGLTAGFLGVFALGVAIGPSMMHRDTTDVALSAPPESAPAPTVAEPAPAPRPRIARPSKAVRDKDADSSTELPSKSAVVSPSHPELYVRLKPVLNRGADMSKAADGFRSAQEFATVAHASQNTRVPFMLLKHRVLDERMSLASAILASLPDTNAAAEVAKARAEARTDVASIAS